METASQMRDNRSAFYNAYFECARWSSDIDPDVDFDGRMCAVLTHNAELFYKENEQLIHCDGAPLGEYWDGATDAMRRASMAGHDFWLTQNGHGAGFWDGNWPEPYAAQLTTASEQFAAIEIYIGDDGKVYGV